MWNVAGINLTKYVFLIISEQLKYKHSIFRKKMFVSQKPSENHADSMDSLRQISIRYILARRSKSNFLFVRPTNPGPSFGLNEYFPLQLHNCLNFQLNLFNKQSIVRVYKMQITLIKNFAFARTPRYVNILQSANRN